MNTKYKFIIVPQCHPFGAACMVAVTLLFGGFASSAQTGDYMYSGSEQTITLNPGFYDIAVYGAQGGAYTSFEVHTVSGGLGAEMEGEFNFTTVTTLTLLVGGAGSTAALSDHETAGGGGGGGSFVVSGDTPLVVAGGGGGNGSSGNIGSNGLGRAAAAAETVTFKMTLVPAVVVAATTATEGADKTAFSAAAAT
jgi:Glycine rich protein